MNGFDPAKYRILERNVTYRTVDGVAMRMDILYPKSGGPWPGLIWVHGGGWIGGDKAPLPPILADTGCLVASLNYRIFPAFRFPAMIEDVKAAIRYLRAHAVVTNLDPTRIALIGHSAGGHLVALAGLAGEEAGWDVGPYLEQSSRVQAVIPMAGPTDLTRPYPDWADELFEGVFGNDQLAWASPVTHVHPDAPSFMIIHGDKDDVVYVDQAHALHAALVRAGAAAELVIVQNAGHGFEPVGGLPSPSMGTVNVMIRDFLVRAGIR